MSATQDIPIARFDFGALRDFSRPFTPSTVEEPIVVDLPAQPEAPPPPPTFTQDQLERAIVEAREQGRQQGFEEGRQSAMAEDAHRQQALQQALSGISMQMQMAQGTFMSYLKDRQRDLTQLSIGVARQVCAMALKYYPASFFESLVQRCLPILLRQPRLIATVHPDLVEAVEESLRQLRMETGYEGLMEVRAHPGLAPYDAKLHWEDGAAETRADEMWWGVEAALLDQFATATPTVPEVAAPVIPTEPRSS
jgi:flagellar assembly protein FliH